MQNQSMKERIDALERDLLAINCFSNIVSAASNGNGVDLAPSDVAFLLGYLSEESLYKVEAIRMAVDSQAAAASSPALVVAAPAASSPALVVAAPAASSPALVKAPPAADRRRKKATLAAVA